MPAPLARLLRVVLAALLALPNARFERELLGCGGGCEEDCRCTSCVLDEVGATGTDGSAQRVLGCCLPRERDRIPILVSDCTCGHDAPASAAGFGVVRSLPRPAVAIAAEHGIGELVRELPVLAPRTTRPDPEVPPPRRVAV